MAQKQNKQWNGMTSVFRVLIAFALLVLLFPLLTAPYSSPLYVGRPGRAASCQSNMKQIGLALAQYSQDYGDLPPAGTASQPSGWREAIYPYIKSTGVYRCPDDQRNPQASPIDLPQSYAANALCFGNGNKPAALASLSPTAILITDTRGFNGEEWDITSAAFLPSTRCELYMHKPPHYFYEHLSGTLNLLFADGHVEAMHPADTLMPANLWTPNAAPFVGQNLANAQAILTHAEKE